MLKHIFRPKWQHPDPKVRIQAIQTLAADNPALLQLAQHDADDGVCERAIRSLSSTHHLLTLLDSSRTALRNTIIEQLVKSLTPTLAGTPEAMIVNEINDENIIAQLIATASDPEWRRHLLERIEDQSLLGDIALNNSSGDIRLAAAQRISRISILKRVVKQSRGHDKRVARLARERLDAERTMEERPRRQLEICAELEQLVAQGSRDVTGLRRLQQEWQTLDEATASVEVRERFWRAKQSFESAWEAHRTASENLQQQRELCECSEALLQRLEQCAPTDQNCISSVRDALARIDNDWQALSEAPGGLKPEPHERFGEVRRQLLARLAVIEREQDEHAQLCQITEKLEALTSVSQPLNTETLEGIERRWREASSGHKQRHTALLFERYHNALKRARQQIRHYAAEAEALSGEIATLLADLDTALREGQLQSAISLHDRSRDRLQRLTELSPTRAEKTRRRLTRAHARMHKLRDWRAFGSDQVRTELIDAMEALTTAEQPATQRASEIKTLQEQWRQLDRKNGRANDILRQRFNDAATRAYAPVRAHYTQQKQARDQSRITREAFIAELERDFHAIDDWEQPDWPMIDQRLQQAKREWPRLGSVEHADWQALNSRFRSLCERFDTHLQPKRAQEAIRREALIHRVEKLAEESDVERAIIAVKEMQQRWKPSVTERPRRERELWRRFRAACDAIFARRDAVNQARRTEESEHEAAKGAICARIEALTAAPSSWERARNEVESLRSEWSKIGEIAPKRQKALEQRLHRVLSQFDRAETQAIMEANCQALRLLRDKAALCERLETATDPNEISAVEQRWDDLPPLTERTLEEAINARYTAARNGAIDAATQDENLNRCLELLLELEVLSELESPAEYTRQRMAWQVARLSTAMKSSNDHTQHQRDIRHAFERWYTLGAIPAAAVTRLNLRLQRVVEANRELFEGNYAAK